MAAGEPFILLDDARSEGAVDAHLFENPRAVFVAPGSPVKGLVARSRSRKAASPALS